MTKPGRDFERAVYEFVQRFGEDAEVIFDHSVRDRDTGTWRQCDVWVNALVAKMFPVSILVSCKDYKRPLNIGYIETFASEIQSTGAHMGVIYSRTGFTIPAIEKAKAKNITCCRLYKDQPSDIPDVLLMNHFVCIAKPRLILDLKSDVDGIETWADLFSLQVEPEKTIGDIIAIAYHACIKQSLEYQEKNQRFYDCASELEIATLPVEASRNIFLQVIVHWDRYKSPVEATLLNGAYSLTDKKFVGEQLGPVIDTQGEHPGPHWEKIADPHVYIPTNALIFFRSSTDEDMKRYLTVVGGSPLQPASPQDRMSK